MLSRSSSASSGCHTSTSSTARGFPFTTGTVYVKVPFSPSPFITVTGMGADARTPLGSGNITMVAGGMGINPLINTPALITLTLNLPEPTGVVGLASGLGLLGIVTWVRRRARTA